ncbi:MAG TPA: PA2779 family protein [Burkholderiales bacterium]|nr:PA2779 family protein [Burkholderiales bacterium]
MQKRVYQWVAALLIVSLLPLPLPTAHAALVTTDQVFSGEQTSEARERISAFLDRQEVQAQLQQYGVGVDEAKARVNALTNDEAKSLAGKLDSLPAGGVVGEILGAALIVFIVLLITDILGFTKVFPFTRPVKR